MLQRLMLSLAAACALCACSAAGGFFGHADDVAEGTDSRDCRTCRKLRFCAGLSGQQAADCAGDDQEEDAEDKWDDRLQDRGCNAAAYRRYVCVRKMDPCAFGAVIPVCKQTCADAKLRCEGRSAATCEGLPSHGCWSTGFEECPEKPCTGLDFCAALEGRRVLRCGAERAAEGELDALLSRSPAVATRALCPREFLAAYVCHGAMKPCSDDGVAEHVCQADCYRFHRHCLRLGEGPTQQRCASAQPFYCTSVSGMLSRETQERVHLMNGEAAAEAAGSSNFLITFVLFLCMVQIIVLRLLQGSRPSVTSSLTRSRSANVRL